MKSDKDKLYRAMIQSVQRSGTLNVIHTNAIANKIGLSATEFEAHDIITHKQPVSAGDLSKYCGVTTGAITGIVDRLERACFVKRVNDPTDRRRVLIEPIENPDLMLKVHNLYKPLGSGFRSVLEGYSDEEIRTFIEINNKLSDVTEKVTIELREKN